jgi:hypothetical protein
LMSSWLSFLLKPKILIHPEILCLSFSSFA